MSEELLPCKDCGRVPEMRTVYRMIAVQTRFALRCEQEGESWKRLQCCNWRVDADFAGDVTKLWNQANQPREGEEEGNGD